MTVKIKTISSLNKLWTTRLFKHQTKNHSRSFKTMASSIPIEGWETTKLEKDQSQECALLVGLAVRLIQFLVLKDNVIAQLSSMMVICAVDHVWMNVDVPVQNMVVTHQSFHNSKEICKQI